MKKLDVPQSGSQADTTASRNRFGQYNRTRSMPTQPRTAAQVQARQNLSTASKAWSQLTDEQRIAWNAYATAHPITDSLGQTVALTGHMMFVSVNTSNMQAGYAAQDNVPNGIPIESPILVIAVATAAGLSVTATAPIPLNTTAIVFVSPPMSPGRSFNGDFRIVAVNAGTNAANQVVLTAANLSAKYGTLAANQKFFISAILTSGGNVSPRDVATVVLS